MDRTVRRGRVAVVVAIPVVVAVVLLYVGPVRQDVWLPAYHDFADRRTILGVPNFWNVITNLAFAVAALAGLQSFRSRSALLETWERAAYGVLLTSLMLIAVGSGYYHLWPSNATLFWDRLPMATAFTATLAMIAGERIAPRRGVSLLLVLVATGVISVVYWRLVDDLRPYVLVQFCAVVGVPLMLILFPPRYTGSAAIAAMAALYGVALLLDRFDRQVGTVLVTGGHPWKHVFAAAGAFVYLVAVSRRRVLKPSTRHARMP